MRELALNTALLQMGHDRMMRDGGECRIGVITKMVGNPTLIEDFNAVYEIPQEAVDTSRGRFYRIVSLLETPPIYYVVAVTRNSCIYFLNGFSKISWSEFVHEEFGMIDSETSAMSLAKLYLQTVEAEYFWGNIVIETLEDIEQCKSQVPDSDILPVIIRGADGAFKVVIHSCDASSGAFWRHEFRFRVTGETELESTKI